jgi:hypothetical protein
MYVVLTSSTLGSSYYFYNYGAWISSKNNILLIFKRHCL